MDWFSSHPVAVDASRLFLERAAHWTDPVIAIHQDEPVLSKRIAWLLLGCALQQGISLDGLARFLQCLDRNLGDEALFSLPAPREDAIQECLRTSGIRGEWDLLPHVPGIIWSVGQFIRNRGRSLEDWTRSSSSREIWRGCGEIYYMGKNSPQRPKVLSFLFRLTAPSPVGLGLPLLAEGGTPPLPSSMGARRWLSWIGPFRVCGYAEAQGGRRLSIMGDIYKKLSPDRPWLACHGLQFFTDPLANTYYCAHKMGGCAQCPLQNECPRTTGDSR